MSILYRAIWTDEPANGTEQAIDALRVKAAAWTREVDDAEPLPEGDSELDVSQGRHRTIRHRSLGANGFEIATTDRKPDDPTDWVTVIRTIAMGDQVHTMVELSMSSDDLVRRVSVGRPRVVHSLLSAASSPKLGGGAILSEPLAIPGNHIIALTEILARSDRALPVIVCAEPGDGHGKSWLHAAEKIANRVEGVATVITLDRQAVSAFRREFGQLAVWDGGIRMYAPGAVTKDSDGWRHRYYRRGRLEQQTTSTIDRIVYSVAQLSTRRRVPEVFNVFGEVAASLADVPDGMIRAEDFADARDQWEFDLELIRDEQSELEKELARANGHLARLKEALIEQGMTDLLWGTQHEDTTSIPDEVQDTSDAATAAQAYLANWLALPDSAIRELEDIDTAPESYSWGNKTWRGFRALAAYAKDRANGWDRGGFWEWCASGPLLGWPATSKKLSMSESEGVQSSAKLKKTREFKIDRAVNGADVITMLAHLKIAEGGGNLAPRVYFHDDTGGATGKVHVGLVGPHYLVPNLSTN